MKKLLWFAIIVLLIFIIGSAMVVWRRPLAVFAKLGRRGLTGAGLRKMRVETKLGPQVIFEGGTGPVLVFLHGAGDQAGAWSKVAPAFMDKYRVMVLDLPGHGESAPAEGPLSVGTIVNGVGAVLDQQTGSLTIVGNSLGGWVAMLYAREHPERIARLVVINGGAVRGERPDLTLMPANREEARKLFDALMDPGSPRVPDFVLDDVVREAHNGPISRMAAAGDMANFLLDGKLQEVKVPMELVWGEADRMLPLDYAQRMQAQLPAARLTTIPRCGHVPQQECPLTLTATLKKVLGEPAASGR